MQLLGHLPLAALALATATSAYVIDTYSGQNCGGSVQSVNVWDNTCAGWMNDFWSIRVRGYGAGQQRAYICHNNGCHDCFDWWADGGSDTFLINQCITFTSVRRTAGSFRGIPRLAEGEEIDSFDLEGALNATEEVQVFHES